VDSQLNTSDMVFTPLVITGRYVVEVTSLMLNKTRITEQFTTVVDSGSTFTYFPSLVYKQLTMLLFKAVGSDGPCWPLSVPLESFPPIRVFFGGALSNGVAWYADDYLYMVSPRGKPAQRCLAFSHAKDSVLGASWMQRKNVMFDITKGQLGVASANCPERKVRERNVFAEHEEEPQHALWTVRLVSVLILLTLGCGFYDKYSRQSRICDRDVQLRVPLEPIMEEM